MSWKKQLAWTGMCLLLSSTAHAQVTVRVSVNSNGDQANGICLDPSVSADGRYVAFWSYASFLVAGDTNNQPDVFVRDRQTGVTERMSVSSAGAQGDGNCQFSSISADGRYVAFASFASNLVPGDTNEIQDIFVRDRQTGTTERVSVDSAGTQGSMDAHEPSLSADGRYVTFWSEASDYVSNDTNAAGDVFVRDRQTGTTDRVSVDSAGTQGNDWSWFQWISADGRYVAFQSVATNLVPGDTNGFRDVFVRDRLNHTTELVSVGSTGTQGNGDSGYDGCAISGDGRYVAFGSGASNLVVGDTNDVGDVFVCDRQTGTIERVSVDSAGTQGNDTSGVPSLSADGRCVAFGSAASNLVPWDTNGFTDIFLRDRQPVVPAFTSRCVPASAGVIPCPCSNPPAGPDRGCDNSAGSGGASLAARGSTQLSADGLVFTTSGEMPSALSVLVQGNTFLPAGVSYGQGVRCLGGRLLRLYSKTAVAGVIRAPDRDAGDAPISVRSASKGDVIHAGQSRWYAVYYRDPTVLGSCPASSTFNSSQAGEIAWSF